MEEEVKRLQERFQKGEKMAAVGLIEAGLVSGKFGTDFEREEEVMTAKLGFKKLTLEEMVPDTLAGL
ncbi:hypothetical protein QBC38DRAFT_462047 [Podospora fimiseda]|uniref:Uncharacterized protein n=1 Tax=Podospora fimiseda TaxID=252190 RepID=A0AAN7BGE8_9PEZI|nr:hypothetical protein QBC38DRAFT_462047 [Podospora fimiseda]